MSRAMSTCYNPFSLQGKKILVTGASSGIGKAIAIEASRLGAELVISARNHERLSKTLEQLEGNKHVSFEADLTDATDCESLSESVPKLDGCVLCLGTSLLAPIQYVTREKLDKVFDANFFAPVELLRLLLKKKRIIKGGSIVCLASIGGITSFDYAHSIYGATKAALSSWMKFAAKELSSKSIRVNNICPGMTQTELATSESLTEEQLKADMLRYPLKRYAEPQEIAFAAAYLLSDASAWMTGTDLIIDGGLSLT